MYPTLQQINCNSTKLKLIATLITLTLLSHNAIAQENPLSTIGEQQINTDKQIVSPFKNNSGKTKNQAAQKGTLDKNINAQPAQPDKAPETLNTPTASGSRVEDLKGTSDPNVKNMLADPKNPIGLGYPYAELDKAVELLKKKDIVNAKKTLEPIATWLTTMTEYHSVLFQKLNNLETAKNQAQVEKKLAFSSAMLRDKTYYTLALIYIEEKDFKNAIKYFVEVIKSQPSSEMGMKSYEILQQIGFTDKVRLIP